MSDLESYIVATGTAQELKEFIDGLLARGFVPYGEPFGVCSETVVKRHVSNPEERIEFHSVRFCQAMVKSKSAAQMAKAE
jgi:hypothetical protein